MRDIVLKIANLSVRSAIEKKIILKNVSLEIERKTIHLLIGPNGSGKSTLARTLMGLGGVKVVSGQIYFLGEEITRIPIEERAKLGMTLAFQEPAYFEGVRVRDFLRVSSPKISEKELKKSLRLVGLKGDFLDRELSNNLSGGERKRIELASLILLKPKLLILDEVDSGLDIIIYRELYDILKNIKEETEASVLLITHREETGFIANKASLLNKGRITLTGCFPEVMRRYCQSVGRRELCHKSYGKRFIRTS